MSENVIALFESPNQIQEDYINLLIYEGNLKELPNNKLIFMHKFDRLYPFIEVLHRLNIEMYISKVISNKEILVKRIDLINFLNGIENELAPKNDPSVWAKLREVRRCNDIN